MSEMVVKALVFGLFPALLVYGAATDIVGRRIPNWVSLALFGGFIALAIASGMSLTDFGLSLAVAALAFAFGFFMFALGQMGGGDAKVIAATVPWFGMTQEALAYVVAFSVAGVIVTVPFLLRRIGFVQVALASNPLSARLVAKSKHKRETPYGVALAAGGLLMVPVLARMHGVL